jgi:hypothetical protein
MASSYQMPWHRRRPGALIVTAAVAIAVTLTGCASSSSGSDASKPPRTPAATTSSTLNQPAPASSQPPVSAEHNPPGDIPDTTVYVAYRSSTVHAVIKVPEGWARQQTATGAMFSSNLNSITLAATRMTATPTVAAARGATVSGLRRSTLAFRLQSVRAVTLAGGSAVEIVYQINSKPNAVTGRQYRLVVERFEFYRAGRGAVLSLSSAVGSDNVDPWRTVSESFRWA